MSLIITRNFKRAKAQDVAARDRAPDGWWEGKTIFAAFGWGKSVKGKVVSHKNGVIKLADGTTFKESDAYDLYAIDSSASDAAAQDIQLPFIITFNNGKKEFREGYSEEEVRRRFDKSVAALYGGIKSVKLEDEDKRNGKDSIAADAKFKKGDKVVSVKTGAQGVVNEVYGEEKYAVLFNGAANPDRVEGFQIRLANSRATDVKDSAAGDTTTSKFKPNDIVEWRDAHGRHNAAYYVRDNGDRVTVSIEKNGQGGGLEIPKAWITNSHATDSRATDYDPNPQTRGKDIEVFSAQAIREESACENVLRKVIEDVEALVIKIHGPMSSWEEVIENSEMSPELPQAKKWSGTANRRYDYLLARERAISSILSELKRNHID